MLESASWKKTIGMTLKPETLLEPVVSLARKAGRATLKVYESSFEVSHKPDQSPLTEADIASHEIICSGLAALKPRLPILSEESYDNDYSRRSGWHDYGLVDPLDGTKEFVNRNGEFTVNIALISDHRPVLGVVHVPVSDITYTGCSGAGAARRSAARAGQQIRVSPLPNGPVRVLGSRSHRGKSLDRFLGHLGDYEFIGVGSSIKLCMVAEGRADIYPRLGPTSEWDTAAAQCVVESAGGQVTDTEGHALRYNTRPEILNPSFLVYGDTSRDWLALL